ncbi:uncharacterized protein SCDLUD_000633 [Saccharomycodes ludwigii]|uniref:uncharacterized protein n=1 Tax=Saccharomycodes ludwigii TaxID=36035 RepID=UPI001E8A2F87|nr:hypothetical protein SCDLUD_000633 [Saccharomycodes ludwigii]KAH3903025.1 hypothetical protein SCDLUD_000633 [Saccharomycodes ludwigii]
MSSCFCSLYAFIIYKLITSNFFFNKESLDLDPNSLSISIKRYIKKIEKRKKKICKKTNLLKLSRSNACKILNVRTAIFFSLIVYIYYHATLLFISKHSTEHLRSNDEPMAKKSNTLCLLGSLLLSIYPIFWFIIDQNLIDQPHLFGIVTGFKSPLDCIKYI